MKKSKTCLSCNKEVSGRSDKKFCDAYCKSSFHYNKMIEDTPKFYSRVDKQLKLNRRILKIYNKAGKVTVRSNVVLDLGFDPNFFTHYWKNNKDEVYLFVYEFGFMKKKESGIEKYILVKWQDYMLKK
ncbi:MULTISPECIES: hypothetical protein [unclassified Olleya]|jgi:hypothetical protein|uniref:hypothetical protein n=1 Tax=unclassified Olleya TaxID=2615019 RepID=UPI0011A87CE6|nr:hypothetical protein [Olleya sp. Hel_I_94]TVZ47423.1 hypothetical protein JM82_2030 [Olleya sp. Hel_I_94]